MKLGYVGLGAMGGALARRLMLTHTLHVLDKSPQLLEEFATDGAIPAKDGASLAQKCDVIMLCLPRSSNVREAIFGPQGLLEGLEPGKIIIDQTSGYPEETREMASALAERGITMIDAPVSPGPEAATAGTITIMIGGPEEVYEKVKPVFESISPNLFYCGDVGAAQTLKLINNMMSVSCRLISLEAMAIGRKYGIQLEKMIEVINQSGGRNRATEIALPKLLKGERSTNFAIGLMLKDVNLATQLGINCGAPLFLGNSTRALLQLCVNTYGENANLDETATFIESLTGVKFVE